MKCMRDSWIMGLCMAAAAFATHCLAAEVAAAKPSFEGVWQIERAVTTVKTADGQVPPLNAAAKKLYMQRVAKYRAGDAKSYDNTFLCKPMGDPRTGYEGQPFDIVQGEDTIFVGYTWNRMVRFIYLKDQHSELPGPTYYGTWIGKWDGAALVFDGIGFNDSTLLDAAGMPHSDDLHIVQRLALKGGGNTLTIQTTFEDPKTFTKTWTAKHTYRKLPGAVIQEDVCPLRLKLDIY
jgi:hypothetical protein